MIYDELLARKLSLRELACMAYCRSHSHGEPSMHKLAGGLPQQLKEEEDQQHDQGQGQVDEQALDRRVD